MTTSPSHLAADPAMVRLARSLARRVTSRHRARLDAARIDRVDYDRVESAAMLGLARAARDYRPDAGAAFGSYAYARIRFEVVDDLRRATAADRKGHDPGPLPDDDGDGGLVDPASLAPAAWEQADAFEALLWPLPARLKSILRLLYLDPATRGDRDAVARAAGLKPNTVSKAHMEAIAILRRRAGS